MAQSLCLPEQSFCFIQHFDGVECGTPTPSQQLVGEHHDKAHRRDLCSLFALEFKTLF